LDAANLLVIDLFTTSIYKGVSDKNNIGEAPCSAVMFMIVAIFLELEARAKQERMYAPLATAVVMASTRMHPWLGS
jgi:hypothetical protein